MSQKQYYLLFLILNIALLFAYIFKQNMILALQRDIQKQEQHVNELQKKKKDTYNQIKELQQHTILKKRAEKELGMRPTKLEEIVSLSPVERK